MKRILDARILDPNFWVEFFDTVYSSKRGPLKNSPSTNSPPKIHLPKFNPEIGPKNSHCTSAGPFGLSNVDVKNAMKLGGGGGKPKGQIDTLLRMHRGGFPSSEMSEQKNKHKLWGRISADIHTLTWMLGHQKVSPHHGGSQKNKVFGTDVRDFGVDVHDLSVPKTLRFRKCRTLLGRGKRSPRPQKGGSVSK